MFLFLRRKLLLTKVYLVLVNSENYKERAFYLRAKKFRTERKTSITRNTCNIPSATKSGQTFHTLLSAIVFRVHIVLVVRSPTKTPPNLINRPNRSRMENCAMEFLSPTSTWQFVSRDQRPDPTLYIPICECVSVYVFTSRCLMYDALWPGDSQRCFNPIAHKSF